MNLYKYDDSTLEFKKVSLRRVLLNFAAVGSITMLVGMVNAPRQKVVETLTPEERLIVVIEETEFTEEKFIEEIKRLNFKFPHIVLAQAQIESGHFTSAIFKENHNLFGMRQARVRANLARGTRRGHAYYDNWKESLYDYAFYYSEYLSDIKTEEGYYQYINQNYAEDPSYNTKVKRQATINKELFN